MKLALGTVQFGLPYGVANTTGKVDCAAAALITSRARMAGMDTLDTAIAYGDSEQCLGEVGVDDWRVVTKLPGLAENSPDVAAWVAGQVHSSLGRLGVKRLYALLLHRATDLLSVHGKELYDSLQRLKERGFIQKIGVSIYSPEDLDAIVGKYPIDLVQLPFNVIDRRVKTTGWLTRLKEHDIEVHARSVFLQGLLLMSQQDRPKKFQHWNNLWKTWHSWLLHHAIGPLEASIGYVLAQPEIDRIIVGVDSASHLEQILQVAKVLDLEPPAELSVEEEMLINPSQWGKL